jgi:hypothetical protein
MKEGPAVQLDLSLTPVTSGEFWTSRQRAGNSLHEISYRACFKPPLARYFIERFSAPGGIVYDPFMGRGTTPLEAALVGRVPWGRDANPLSEILLKPRLLPPSFEEVRNRLEKIDFNGPEIAQADDLLVFFHAETLREILALRHYLNERARSGALDPVDAWIRMVAINRLTGHSPGFFSVYSMPPNQAVSLKSQIRINERRKQKPPRRIVPDLIARKSKALLKDVTPEIRANLAEVNDSARITTGDARSAPEMAAVSAELVLTSPPFLDVVDYATDNWLRCWFAGIDLDKIRFDQHRRVEDWCAFMVESIGDSSRILKPGGTLALEIGEVRAGTIRLEEHIVPLGHSVGLRPVEILINDQAFTKTAHTWGVTNNTRGTNTNRIVIFRKD